MLKCKEIFILCVIGLTMAAVLVGASGMMLVENTRYFCASSGNWNDNSSWNTADDCASGIAGKPDSDDPAVILSGKTATVDTTTAECKTLTVQSTATVNIGSGNKLTIQAVSLSPSSISGTVYLQGSGSELFIDDTSHTIGGSGEIVGQNDAAIIKVKQNMTQTLDANATLRGRLKIQTEAPSGQNNRTKFENKGTVNADTSGILKVEGDAVDTSTGNWKVTASGATLQWADGSSDLLGHFTVSAGLLEVDNTITTSGTLTMTGGKIRVDDGGATFNN